MNSNYSYKYQRHFQNPQQDNNAYTQAKVLFPNNDCEQAQATIVTWAGYQPTPLHQLTDIAHQAKVGNIYYKDESGRFELGSFKALGGSYAVQQLFKQHQQQVNASPLVVCTATDGNHGRSVAWGSQLLGVECHIFIHEKVSENRAQSMSDLGAIVHRVAGNYDDSIAECIQMSEQHQWHIVSDTSWKDYNEVPRQVMAGYSVMANEIIQQMGDTIPSHIFIPAGCGGLAGAMIAYFWAYWREQLPTIVIVESSMSPCVYESLVNDKVLLLDIVDETIMAGLSCGEVSLLAWPLLKKGVSHVITLDDDGVVPMMRWLAKPEPVLDDSQRPTIEAGECSASSLMALMAIRDDAELAKKMGLNEQSNILVLGTEGATDLEFYQSVVN